jgi:hypothetical protein
MLGSMGVTPRQLVAVRDLACVAVPFEQVCIADAIQCGTGFNYAHPGRTGNECPHHFLACETMPSEHRERIMVARLQQAPHFGRKFGRWRIRRVGL